MATVKDLTGGTGDVNPQILTVNVTQTAADTTTTDEIALPVPRFSAKKGRSLVIEILKVDAFVDDYLATGAANSVRGFLDTSGEADNATEPTTFYSGQQDLLFATAIGFQIVDRNIGRTDYTDNAGHGFLVATDSIFATVATQVTGRINIITFKILYRFKEVTLQEYIGIVQGQQ